MNQLLSEYFGPIMDVECKAGDRVECLLPFGTMECIVIEHPETKFVALMPLTDFDFDIQWYKTLSIDTIVRMHDRILTAKNLSRAAPEPLLLPGTLVGNRCTKDVYTLVRDGRAKAWYVIALNSGKCKNSIDSTKFALNHDDVTRLLGCINQYQLITLELKWL